MSDVRIATEHDRPDLPTFECFDCHVIYVTLAQQWSVECPRCKSFNVELVD